MAIELVKGYLDEIEDDATRNVVSRVLELEEFYSSYKNPQIKGDVAKIVREEADAE